VPAKEKKLPPDLAEVDLLIRAKEANETLLRSKPYVIGLDVGYRIKGGKKTDERVVIVYVSRKIDKSELAKEHLIPQKIKIGVQEVLVDVVEGAIDEAYIFDLRSRPLRGGSSISLVTQLNAGTGGVCVTLNDGNTYILSNNHVIAGCNQTPIGSAIMQPGLQDGGNAANDTVATLFDFVPLAFGPDVVELDGGGTVTISVANYVDAAIAKVANGYNDGNREIHWIGYPRPLQRGAWSDLERLSLLGLRVCKMGRTTEFTIGSIVSVSYDCSVAYPNGQSAWFANQIRIEGENGPFARRGDSGSLVVDFETRAPIGLLFAGRGDRGIANPIHQVLTYLSIPQI
jgi:hypothetical protein